MDGGPPDDGSTPTSRSREPDPGAGTTLRSRAPAPGLSRLVRDLGRQADPATTLGLVVERALDLVTGAEQATVSLLHRHRRTTTAAVTHEAARAFEELQRTLGEGPVLDVVHEHRTVRVDDLSAEQRWPRLAQRWTQAGVRSALCLPLYVHGQDLGVLSALSGEVGAFDEDAEQWGLLVASHGAVALAAALQVEGLQAANANRTVIGQAEGILMERLKVDARSAFTLLSSISQNSNRKLVAVAEEVVRTGEIPAGEHRA